MLDTNLVFAELNAFTAAEVAVDWIVSQGHDQGLHAGLCLSTLIPIEVDNLPVVYWLFVYFWFTTFCILVLLQLHNCFANHLA